MEPRAARRAIRHAHPEIQVIAVTSSHEDELVSQALRAGAIAYLLKDVSVTRLGDAIRAAKAGPPTLAPEATKRSTVNFHVSNILGKLGAASRTEAVSIALQHRLTG